MARKKKKRTMMDAIAAFIPRKIGNVWVLGIFEVLRWLDHLRPRNMKKRGECIKRELEAHRGEMTRGGFIEDQHAYKDVHYGHATLAFSGCEVIALYNALWFFEREKAPLLESLLTAFEQDGILLHGFAGTSPKALEKALKKRGFTTEFSHRPDRFSGLLGRYPAFLLTFYNNEADVRDEVHTVCVTKEENGFTAHNVDCNGSICGPYSTYEQLFSAINGGKAKPIALMGIRP